MACQHQIEFLINQSVDEVFGYLSSFPKIAGFKVKLVDRTNHQIHLSAPITLFSNSEKITIYFIDSQNDGTRIIVFSKSILPTTVIDYGKNKKNAEEIMASILWIYGPKNNEAQEI